MLDDYQRVATNHESLEHRQKAPHIRQMKARRWLVEHVHGGLMGGARRQLRGKLQALRLAARQCVRALADLDVADAEVSQRRQRARDSGVVREEGGCVFGRQVKDVADRQTSVTHLESRRFKA